MTTALIIEDNPVNMILAIMVLERAGYRVLQADQALTGLQLARQHLPEVILMDIQLPGMDGLSATQELKADPHTAGIKVIALTAYTMAGDQARFIAAGCDDYISKPIRYKELLAAVERVLRGSLVSSEGAKTS